MVIFLTVHPKGEKNLYNLCDIRRYTWYNCSCRATTHEWWVTTTRGTVFQLIREVENVSHKLFMENYFSL